MVGLFGIHFEEDGASRWVKKIEHEEGVPKFGDLSKFCEIGSFQFMRSGAGFLILEFDTINTSRALYGSLVQGPLLVVGLPEAGAFSKECLEIPTQLPELNFQQKLGHLYEDALAHLLEASLRVELLETNLQIQESRQNTVGELDYLIRDLSSGGLVHLELAVKFYLAVEIDEMMVFPGPDARDNYHRKLARLREHQLVLCRKYRDLLPEKYRGEEIEVKQLIYGSLFDHVDAGEPSVADFISPNCRRGKWLYQSELTNDFLKGREMRVVPKSLWPVPFELLDGFLLERWIGEKPVNRCVMLRVEEDESPYFVVPRGYPSLF